MEKLPITPQNADTPLAKILNSVLSFTFDCEPKNAIKKLKDTLLLFESQLKENQANDLIPLIQEIVINRFEEQFPNVYDNMKVILDLLLETELAKLQKNKSITPVDSNFEHEKPDLENIISIFKIEIMLNFNGDLPKLILNRYADSFREIVTWYSEIPRPELPKEKFKEMCDSFIRRLSAKSTILFDTNEMKITEGERIELFCATINSLAFCKTIFNKEENSDWVKIIFTMCKLMPVSIETEAEKRKIIEKLGDVIDRTERKGISRYGLMMIINEIGNFNKNQLVLFTLSFFTVISGYYQSNGAFVNSKNSPILRATIRKMLKKFQKLLSPELKSLASMVNFAYYKVFEQSIGEFLNIFSPEMDLRLRGRISLTPVIMNTPYIDIYLKKWKITKENLISKNLELINLTPSRRSPHAVICFSGFMSEDTKKKSEWTNLIESDKESCIYAVNWPSYGLISLLTSDLSELGITIAASVLLRSVSFLRVFNSVENGAINVMRRFSEAEKQAKITGRLLAHVIAKNNTFNGQHISLMGFSLGTRAVLSCVKELSNIRKNEGLTKNIDNVVLIGGASILKSINLNKWNERFNVASGKVINIYAKNDWAMKLMSIIKGSYLKGDYPIGSCELQFRNSKKQVSEESLVECKDINVFNFDVTAIVKGHLWYRTSLKEILMKVNFG